MSEQWAVVDPSKVHFTFSRIRPQFSCGRTIQSTIDEIVAGKIAPKDLPSIQVLQDKDGNLFSMNNRRLFVFKQLQRLGLLESIQVRLRSVPQTKRMAQKYTPESCALEATLMPTRAVKEDETSSNDEIDKEDEEPTAAPKPPPPVQQKAERKEIPPQKVEQKEKQATGKTSNLADELARLKIGDANDSDEEETQKTKKKGKKKR